MGELFNVLITMDELLRQNTILADHWALYKRWVIASLSAVMLSALQHA